MFKSALLMTLIGSVMFLYSCTEDEETIQPPTAAFTATVDGATVTLVNNSVGGDSFVWDYGDGTTSTAESPGTKTYTETDEYTIELTVTNDGGSDVASETVTIEVAAVDEEAPVITLAGESVVDVPLGETYTDQGAGAEDNVDGTVVVVVGGDEVNTEMAGTYTITYDATDAAGNVAEQVTRIVRVRYPGDLIANSDFEGATDGNWYVNFGDNTVPVQKEGMNTFFIVNIETANAEQPFVVNLSQVINIDQGKTYKLSFDASSDVERGIIAGIGLAGGSFANNTQVVTLSTTTERYEMDLRASFGEDGVDNRVIFDLAVETGVVVIDNVRLEETEASAAVPTEGPAAPTQDAANVVSVYSNTYENVANDGFNLYGNASFNEVDLNGNNVLQYTLAEGEGGNFQVIELGGANAIDASGYTNFRFDAWFSNEVGDGASFIMKVVDFSTGGATEAIITIDAASSPALSQGAWLSYDFSLDQLSSLGLTANTAVQQIVIDVVNVGEVYIDNIYFYEGDGGGGTTSPAPTDAPTAPPARDAADVISIYGDAYGTAIGLNNVSWDEGSEASVETHAGNEVLKLDFNTFLGTDLGSEVDASAMTHVHIDFWIADDFNAGQVFLPKWSNHNGAEETDAFERTYAVGAEDSQKWLSIDVPISDWTNVRGNGPDARANLKQLVIGVSGTLDVVYMDNVYFYKN